MSAIYRRVSSAGCLAGTLMVGTALALINHGARLFTGPWDWDLLWKVLATYVLSFLLVAYVVPSTNRRKSPTVRMRGKG